MLLRLAAAREEGRRGMLIAEINGEAAAKHSAARLFIDEGFAVTAMGLQARTERLRPRGFAAEASSHHGTAIAAVSAGGRSMADKNRSDTRSAEHDRIRKSNDRDQAMERQGESAPHNRGYDEAADGRTKLPNDALGMGDDVDPDSAEAEVDRDDSISDIDTD